MEGEGTGGREGGGVREEREGDVRFSQASGAGGVCRGSDTPTIYVGILMCISPHTKL